MFVLFITLKPNRSGAATEERGEAKRGGRRGRGRKRECVLVRLSLSQRHVHAHSRAVRRRRQCRSHERATGEDPETGVCVGGSKQI